MSLQRVWNLVRLVGRTDSEGGFRVQFCPILSKTPWVFENWTKIPWTKLDKIGHYWTKINFQLTKTSLTFVLEKISKFFREKSKNSFFFLFFKTHLMLLKHVILDIITQKSVPEKIFPLCEIFPCLRNFHEIFTKIAKFSKSQYFNFKHFFGYIMSCYVILGTFMIHLVEFKHI